MPYLLCVVSDHFVLVAGRLRSLVVPHLSKHCVLCEQCFLIDIRFDVRLCTLSIVIVFVALEFALKKILKSYTLEIYMFCNTFMY